MDEEQVAALVRQVKEAHGYEDVGHAIPEEWMVWTGWVARIVKAQTLRECAAELRKKPHDGKILVYQSFHRDCLACVAIASWERAAAELEAGT